MDAPHLTPLTENVWIAQRNQRYHGVEVGTRMTVLRLKDGVLLHSPIDAAFEAVESLGPVRWALGPNLLHHLYLAPWAARGVALWGAPGLDQKRKDLRFEGLIEEECEPFGPEVLVIPLRCFAMTREVVLHHRPSGTLVVTDLFFNFGAEAPWFTRWVMRLLGGFPGPGVTVLEKVGMKRDIARREVTRLLELDFDRVILAHGALVPSGGRQVLRDAFRWLL
jgi:hypothetical protein